MDPESVLRLKEEAIRLKVEAIELKLESIELKLETIDLKLEAVDAADAEESQSGTGSASFDGIVASGEDSMVEEQPASVAALTRQQRWDNFRNNFFPSRRRTYIEYVQFIKTLVWFEDDDQLIVDVRRNLPDGLKWFYDELGGGTPLHWFVRMEDLHLVTRILEAGKVNVNAKDKGWEATALHWAVRTGNLAIVKAICTYHSSSGKIDLGVKDKRGFNALEYAVLHGEPNIAMVIQLLKVKDVRHRYDDKMRVVKHVEEILQLGGSSTEVERRFDSQREAWYDKLNRKGSYLYWAMQMEDVALIAHILAGGKVNVNGKIGYGKYDTLSPLSSAVRLGNMAFVKLMVSKHMQSHNFDVNAVDSITGYTALHWAVVSGRSESIEMVMELLKCESTMRLTEECKHGKTPLQLAHDRGYRDIQKVLMEREVVRRYIEDLYRDRQVYVDAANAILVGAALIASVTFASWLQPPLGYTPDYANVQQHVGLRAFWLFNCLSFYFAIATVVFGARSVLPRSPYFIKETVEKLRKNLLITAILLACSVFFVIIAFGIAGCIVLTPIVKFQLFMIIPTILGGLVCLISLGLLSQSMWDDSLGRNHVPTRRHEWSKYVEDMYDE